MSKERARHRPRVLVCLHLMSRESELKDYIAKKEAKRLEKAAKFAAKTSKAPPPAAAAAPASEKKKPVKETKEEEAPFVNTTPAGEKKGKYLCTLLCSISFIFL